MKSYEFIYDVSKKFVELHGTDQWCDINIRLDPFPDVELFEAAYGHTESEILRLLISCVGGNGSWEIIGDDGTVHNALKLVMVELIKEILESLHTKTDKMKKLLVIPISGFELENTPITVAHHISTTLELPESVSEVLERYSLDEEFSEEVSHNPIFEYKFDGYSQIYTMITFGLGYSVLYMLPSLLSAINNDNNIQFGIIGTVLFIIGLAGITRVFGLSEIENDFLIEYMKFMIYKDKKTTIENLEKMGKYLDSVNSDMSELNEQIYRFFIKDAVIISISMIITLASYVYILVQSAHTNDTLLRFTGSLGVMFMNIVIYQFMEVNRYLYKYFTKKITIIDVFENLDRFKL